jgi:hypothetical protein
MFGSSGARDGSAGGLLLLDALNLSLILAGRSSCKRRRSSADGVSVYGVAVLLRDIGTSSKSCRWVLVRFRTGPHVVAGAGVGGTDLDVVVGGGFAARCFLMLSGTSSVA